MAKNKTILILDLGSHMNNIGGQNKVAKMLFDDLSGKFNTYYLGYETAYFKKSKNMILLKRGRMLNDSARKSAVSELQPVRALYNFIVVRNMVQLRMELNDILEQLKMIKPDIVVANAIQDITLINYLRSHGIEFKSIYIDHGSVSTNIKGYFSKEGIPLTFGTGIFGINVDSIKRKFFNSFDMCIALNVNQLKEISKFTQKVAYIPNSVKSSMQIGKSKLLAYRSKFGISKGDFVVLYIGRLFERQKSVSTIIEAFRSISSDNMRLLIVGDGPSKRDYERMAKGDNRIIFAGPVGESEVDYIYELCDVYVLASKWEGTSLTLIEAFNHSLPVIISQSAYTSDYSMDDGTSLISFKTGDANELASRINEIALNLRLRRVAIAASKKMADRFSVKSMMKRYVEILSNL